jgi:hypothetical protein
MSPARADMDIMGRIAITSEESEAARRHFK